uniref:ATP-binding cassette sub-family A member 3-like n=1 Tax=Phallusia mammillata TaxID=59560 RepID=A0A6F9D5Z8_9ASCI|nr:ATP-binding cassette sub-family A member 3-like [Phallusia mammillata]
MLTEEDMEEFLSKKFQSEGGDFNSQNLISATFTGNETTNSYENVAWFNNQAYHSPATSLSYLDQAFIRFVANRSDFAMKLINSPLPRKTSARVQEELVGSLSGFSIAFNIVLGFSFLAASFCLFLVRERVDRSSLLQTLAGVDPFCFWFSTFVWDFVNFITPCLVLMIMFAAFTIEELNDNAGIVFLLFILYCWSSLPLMYSLSFLFVVPSTALVRLTIINMITGLASIIAVNILYLLGLNDIAETLNWIFLFLPQYCLGQGLADVYTNHKMVNVCTSTAAMEETCKTSDINFQTDYLAWESYGVGKSVTFLGVQGVIFFIIIFLIEFDYLPLAWRLLSSAIKWLFSKVVPRNGTGPLRRTSAEDDEDVVNEKKRLNETPLEELIKTDRLLIHNLRKVYETGSNSFVAVDNLCIGIPGGECFGLLGINGAGKTTTFKMLSGDYKSTSGTAYLEGFNINKDLRKVQQRLGYCPQFDGLIEQMTGAETIRMFARLRGVPEAEIPNCVESLGKNLHFAQHLYKNCGTYSGGNKRKLGTAIALVGNPPVVLLDEPSTGMDPGARRMLWDALADVRSQGCSIVITSHSMEECEALCTRLAIMVNGQLRCLGGPQHLKNRFGQGYTIEMKMPISATDFSAPTTFMKQNFPGCDVKDDHQGLITCQVKQYLPDGTALKLSKVFYLMEKSKSEVGVMEYTVSQTTLEQVFLSLVRWQKEAADNDDADKKND